MKDVNLDLSQDTRINRIIKALYRFAGTARLQSLYDEVDTSDWTGNHHPKDKIRQYLQRYPQFFERVSSFNPVTGRRTSGEWRLTDMVRKACVDYFEENKNREIRTLKTQLQEMKQEMTDMKNKPVIVQIQTDKIDVTSMTSPQAAASTTAAPDEPVLTPLQQSLAAYNFTGVSQKNFEMACLLLDAERYTYEGREDYLLLDAKDWYYVGRIAYEVGYFTNQFYTKLSELLEGICLKQASGEEIRIRKCASSSSLSNEGRTFKQPQARLLAGQEQQQWQTVPNYIDEARLRRYEHIATRFLELLRSCDDPTGQSPLTP